MSEEYTAEYFEKRYGEVLERPYESFQWHTKRFGVEFSMLKPQKNERALDIGCGLGNITWALSKRVESCIGIDISEYAIEKAKGFYHNENLKFMVMDATADVFPLADQSFDIVVCCELYEHLDAAQGKALLVNAMKALKDNGRILFIAPINEELVLSIKGFVFRILGKGEIQSDWTHKRSLTLDEIIDVLRKNGFTNIKWRARNAHGKFVSILVDFVSIIPYIGRQFMGSAVVVGFKDNKKSKRIQKS